MTARCCWLLLFGLLITGVLPLPGQSHALADEKLVLAMEYRYPSDGVLGFIFRNQWAHSVTILSPWHLQTWQQYIQVLLPDGQPVLPSVNSKANPTNESDYLQIPARKTYRIPVVVPAFYNLAPGQLYFLKIKIPTNKVGRYFYGVFPYGVPSAPLESWNEGDDLQHRLRLSMQCNDPSMRKFSLLMENYTPKKVFVLPMDFVQPITFYTANGKHLARVSNYLHAPCAQDRFPLPSNNWLHFHVDVEKCWGMEPTPGRLFFLSFRYPTDNNIGDFTGVFPYGIPIPPPEKKPE